MTLGARVEAVRADQLGAPRQFGPELVQVYQGGAVALGDELSDIDAFEAVVAARAATPSFVGVTVAVHGEGKPAPADLLAVADLTLNSARRVGPFLAGLARAIGDPPAG